MHFIIVNNFRYEISFLSVTSSQVASSSNISLNHAKDLAGPSCDELLITHSSIGTNTDEMDSTPTVQKSTKSVASQMTLAELLDEIDLNQVMESAVRRCTPEAILLLYKVNFIYRVPIILIVYQINKENYLSGKNGTFEGGRTAEGND